ncbi:MAG TPA: DUF4193 family protein [Acidimicrobiia bacterium]|nr:DUF4193 family protein [Acidimicrobiia bacterium]
MAKKKPDTKVEELESVDDEDLDLDDADIDAEDLDEAELDVDLEDDIEEPDLDEFEDDVDVDAPGYDADDEDDDDDEDEETTEALEELETQELQLLDEEKNDNLLVDEVEVLRAIRREELTMNVDTQLKRADEFVCQSCFMLKRTSQLANKRKQLCADCAD